MIRKQTKTCYLECIFHAEHESEIRFQKSVTVHELWIFFNFRQKSPFPPSWNGLPDLAGLSGGYYHTRRKTYTKIRKFIEGERNEKFHRYHIVEENIFVCVVFYLFIEAALQPRHL